MFVFKQLVHCKYMTLVNLLADKVIYPEIATTGNPAEWLAQQVLKWLDDPMKAEEVRNALQELKDRVAETGACDRAAQLMLRRAS
jgi:lipid-A-disaccharide synthase